MWSREASSGTTPPNAAWIAIWLDESLGEHAAARLEHGDAGLVAARFDPKDRA